MAEMETNLAYDVQRSIPADESPPYEPVEIPSLEQISPWSQTKVETKKRKEKQKQSSIHKGWKQRRENIIASKY